MTATWPDHQLTLQEWEQLPEDDRFRLELVEGVLSIAPKPYSVHQHAGTSLTYRSTDQLPVDLIALSEVEVVLTDEPLSIRVPDMLVTTTELFERNPARVPAADVRLVTEILSDGTRRIDRVLKFAEYAEYGIPQYWIIDLDAPVTLVAYTLVNGHYEPSGEHSGVVTLPVAGHPVTLDLDALVRRR